MNFAPPNPFGPMPTMPFVPDFQGFAERMMAMPQVMETMQKVKVGATPHQIVYSENKLRLLHYKSDVEKCHRTPLVLAFALVNRPYILDLLPHKSVVRHFLNRGFDVYLVDWGVPSPGDKHLTVSDYVDGYLGNVIDRVCSLAGVDQVSLLGYCMGGTLSAMFTSFYQEKIRNLILMAAPIDWSDTSELLGLWSGEENFDVDDMVDTFGNAPPEWLQGAFALLKPVSGFVTKYLNFYEKMTDQKFVEEFFAMETWGNDNIPVAGETFRAFVKYGFQQNLLVKGKWPVGRRCVDLADITCPILNLVAASDHLVPSCQSLPFNDYVSSKDRKSITLPAGHIGLSVGSRAQRELWPKVCDWLAERSEAL